MGAKLNVWGNEEKEKEVVQWVHDGRTYSEIQKHFRTSSRVIGLIKEKYNINIIHNTSPQTLAKIIRLREANVSPKDMRKHHGVTVSVGQIYTLLRKNGFSREEQQAKIKAADTPSSRVRCKCPYCKVIWYEDDSIFTGVGVQWKYCGNCPGKGLSQSSYSHVNGSSHEIQRGQ